MPAVICNTSPLQYLHQTELRHLLPALFGVVQVPRAVVHEVVEGWRRGVYLPDLTTFHWVAVRSVGDRTLLSPVTNLDSGERKGSGLI